MNWLDRIKRAEKKGEFTFADKRLAEQWTTCAIGERYRLKRDDLSTIRKPRIHRIWTIGTQFSDCIQANNWKDALRLYRKIQDLPPVEKVIRR